MKMKFRAALLGLNYIATVLVSLTILFSEQFSFGEKAVYGTSAILIVAFGFVLACDPARSLWPDRSVLIVALVL